MTGQRIKLPPEVADIYRAVGELEKRYPLRKFTPDGHLVGSLGEVIAAEAFGLTLCPMSKEGHDALGSSGPVQIKATAGKSISMYDSCARLIVLRLIPPDEAEVVYDGPGEPVWRNAGKRQKNGQRSISLNKLRTLPTDEIFGFFKGKIEIRGDIVSPAITPEEWGDLYPAPRPPRPRR